MTTTDRSKRTKPLGPPFLLTTSTDRCGVSVGVIADASTAVVELTVHGQWSDHLGAQVAAGLRLCLAGPSTSIIINLHDVVDPLGTSMPFWLAAGRQAGLRQSPVQLALCLPVVMLGSQLQHLDGRQPLVFVTMRDARMAVAARLSTHRLQIRLAPQPSSVRAARELVAQACHAWDLPLVLHDAELVMSELATNAVEHARTDLVVTVSTADTRLHVAVRDGAAMFPRLGAPAVAGRPAPVGERGRGLHLIHSIAAAWGAMPTRGGKVVWATISSDLLVSQYISR